MRGNGSMWLYGRLAAVTATLLLTAAFAPSPADDPEALLNLSDSQTVTELVVRPAGPAWWTVSSGARKVYILGILFQYPPGHGWSLSTLDRHLEKAERVILPAGFSLAPPPTPPGGARPLTPALAERLAQTAVKYGASPARYQHRTAFDAATLLVADFRASLGAEPGAIPDKVSARAKAVGRKVEVAAIIPGGGYADSLRRAPSAAQEACLEAAIDEVNTGAQALHDAFEAWAVGDVLIALEAPRGMEKCVFTLPGQADMRRKATDATAGAIAKFLASEPPRGAAGLPQGERGRVDAIALVNLRSLLAQGGVLDQLRAKGYEISAPAL